MIEKQTGGVLSPQTPAPKSNGAKFVH